MKISIIDIEALKKIQQEKETGQEEWCLFGFIVSNKAESWAQA